MSMFFVTKHPILIGNKIHEMAAKHQCCNHCTQHYIIHHPQFRYPNYRMKKITILIKGERPHSDPYLVLNRMEGIT